MKNNNNNNHVYNVLLSNDELQLICEALIVYYPILDNSSNLCMMDICDKLIDKLENI